MEECLRRRALDRRRYLARPISQLLSLAESILDVSENVRPFRHIMFEAEEEV